ncbi:MAG: FAD-binding protein, partial [Cellvibrionaceae bacterium]|nr:FAD-binding protein [Cellvibrionaceae bacterium]
MLQQQVALDHLNTLALPCVADYYWPVTNAVEIEAALAWYRQQPLPLLVLGGGSNVILPAHFPGLVIHMQNQGFVIEGDQVRAQSGQNWHQLVAACCQQGRYGLENLALIPGSVGAAPIQNIGAYGVELKDIFISLKCIRI